MALDMTTHASALVAVATGADNVITLSPQRTYDICNTSANPVFFSTDGSAVDADDSEALGKGKLIAVGVTAANLVLRLVGVTTLTMKSTGGAAVVVITHVGSL